MLDYHVAHDLALLTIFERSEPTRYRGAARQWLRTLAEQLASVRTEVGHRIAKTTLKVSGPTREA
jgi:hypothetical protein